MFSSRCVWKGKKNGASEGIRTLDTHVGNVMLYQAELRSLPESAVTLEEIMSIASELLNFLGG